MTTNRTMNSVWEASVPGSCRAASANAQPRSLLAGRQPKKLKTDPQGIRVHGNMSIFTVAPYLLCVAYTAFSDSLQSCKKIVLTWLCQLIFGSVPILINNSSMVKRVARRLKACYRRSPEKIWCSYVVFGRTLGKHPAGLIWANIHGNHVLTHVNINSPRESSSEGRSGEHCEIDEIWIVCSPSFLESLTSTSDDDDIDDTPDEQIKQSKDLNLRSKISQERLPRIIKSGPVSWIYWSIRSEQVKFTRDEVKRLHPDQYNIVHDMVLLIDDIAEKRVQGCNVFYIWGPPGTGKSESARVLAMEMGAVFCDTLNPTEPGNFPDDVIETVNADETHANKPVVFALNEFDDLLKGLNKSSSANTASLSGARVCISNNNIKGSVIDFLDYFSRPGTILVTSGNSPPEEIDKLDTAFMRDGRCFTYYLGKRPLPLSVIQTDKKVSPRYRLASSQSQRNNSICEAKAKGSVKKNATKN